MAAQSRTIISNSLLAFLFCALMSCSKPGPFMATGVKVGEVTDTSAIIWTRLTKYEYRVGQEGGLPTVEYKNPQTGEWEKKRKGRPDAEPRVSFPGGRSVAELEGTCPGANGSVRVLYRIKGEKEWQKTGWQKVRAERDYTRSFLLTNLAPATNYDFQIQAKGNRKGYISGAFRTAPAKQATSRVTFVVSTGQAYNDLDLPDEGFQIYKSMLKLNPDFFVHTGDILYYDRLAKTEELARWHWQRTYSLPTNVEFHRQVASYFIKDDHDTWMNDCWPGMQTKFMGQFTFEQGLKIFLEQVPMSEKTYRTFRWGKDLQIWLVEGRDFRSPNNMPDGPEKTIWGKEQKEWFKRTVHESDATFRILISPTPVVGPDRQSKGDNHSNRAFQHEGDEIRQFLGAQKNMFVICGDRHWQYVSVDSVFGVKEFSCGPASNQHAGGWSNDMLRPEHHYLNVTGGFLAISVSRIDNLPVLSAAHYSVKGELLNLDQVEAR